MVRVFFFNKGIKDRNFPLSKARFIPRRHQLKSNPSLIKKPKNALS